MLSGHGTAEQLTAEAIEQLDSLQSILAHALTVDDRIDWEALKNKSRYDLPSAYAVSEPVLSVESRLKYSEPKVGLFDLILGRKAKLIAAAAEAFEAEIAAWEDRDQRRRSSQSAAHAAWELGKQAFWNEHHAKKAAFEAEQAASHAEVERLKSEVAQGAEDAVIEHASLVLEASDYDDLFEKSYMIQYHPNEKLLMIFLA